MVKKSRKQIYLVDGHALAYRAFYAMIGRPLRTSRGENTSVPWGVTRFVLKLISEHKPEYLGFVFDAGRGETFRHEIYEPYKATREKLDEADAEEFRNSMERVREILEALHIPAFEMEDYEADDVIGTLAVKAIEQGFDAVIVSGDTDFYQLIGPHAAVIEPGRGGPAAIEPQWVDAKAATERFGVPPEKVIDYLALVGDPSDNVPGVRGIGPKTAEALLKRFGTLEEILKHADKIESKRVRQAVMEHVEEVRLSRQLVTIKTDVPVEIDLETLRRREPDRERLRNLFLELEFFTLLREFAPERPEKVLYRRVGDVGLISQLVEEIMETGKMTLEVILDREGPRGGPPIGVALALEPGRAFYLPLNHRQGVNLPELHSRGMKSFAEALSSPLVEKIGHDLKRALLAFRAAGIELSGDPTDTMLAAYCLDPARRDYDLETLVIDRFGHRLENEEVRRKNENFSDGTPGRMTSYAAERADSVLQLAQRLLKELDLYGQRKLYEEIERPLLPVLADMEWVGIGIDVSVLDSMSRDLETKLEQLKNDIHRLAGGEFNIDSVPQLREILFEKLNLPIRKRTKTGPSTDADVMEALAAEGHPLPSKLLEYRELAKLKSTYVDALRMLVSPETGRLHTTFNQAGTATGRLSSSEPNLQNIPIRTPLGASIRKAFVPANGFLMLVADYSQIDLRVLAHVSKDPVFIEAFRSGRDIHRETAALIFGVELSDVSSEMRATAKTVNYATLYGQGAPSLARQLGISEEKAREFIGGYFKRFPAIRSYLDGQIERAEREGYVETIFGRRRYVPELRSKHPGTQGFGRRVAQNTPIQGSAADIIKLAMIRIHERLCREGQGSRMLLQIHDELVFEIPDVEAGYMPGVLRKEMEGVVDLEVPLLAEIGIGKNWYDAKKG